MSDKQLRAKVTINSDPSGLRKIELAASGVSKSVKEIEKDARDANRALAETDDTTTGLESSFRDLREELLQSERKFESYRDSAISMRAEFNRLKESGEGTKESFRSLSKQINTVQATELEAITATRNLISEITELGDDSGVSADEIGDLNKRLQEAEGYITGVGGKAALQAKKMDELRSSTDRVGDGLGELRTATDRVSDGMGGLRTEAGQTTTAVKKVGGALDTANSSLSSIEGKVGTVAYALGGILANAMQEATQAAVQFSKDSVNKFRTLDDEARRAFAQIPNMSADMRENLVSDAKIIASQIGRLPEEVLPAMRKAMNLGISEDNLLSSIEAASMAARISGESLIDTMVLGQSVVNAYGGELYTLSEGYDYLNYITQSSNLEFGDLNANMSGIISASAEAGIGLESVAGAMITMNRQGDSATEIGELLSNVLTQISIEGTALGSSFKAAAGVGFREFTAAGGTLSEGLQILDDYAKATGQDLLNMVGGSSSFFRDVQAARGVLELTGKHAAELATNIEGAAQSTGSLTKAAQEFENGPGLGIDRAAASASNLTLAFGGWLVQLADSISLLENANAVASIMAGTMDSQIGSKTDDIVKEARATRDYAEALTQLAGGFNAAGPVDFGLTDEITTSTEVLIREMARISTSYEDFKAKLSEAGVNQYANKANLNDFAFNSEQLFLQERTQASVDYYNALAQVDYWQTKVINDASGADIALLTSYKNQAGKAVEEAANLVDVLDVLDGDTVTIEVEGEMKSVRFRNINAPEIKHEDAAAMPWAYEAMEKTQKYFDENPLNLQGQMDRESYDRIIAAVPDIERDLVASGLAIPLPVSLTEDPEAFAELEQIAQRAAAAGIGMFKDQALAARVLNGEMVDLGKYYEEMAIHQTKLTGYFKEATGPVSVLFASYQELADAPAWGVEEAKAEVIASNEAIVKSYQETAYEIYLAHNGVTQSTIDMGVAMGVFTEIEGQARLEFANTNTAIEELILSQADLKLTDDELIIATQLLIDGLVKTPEQAANAAKGIDGLGSSAAGARDRVRETHQALKDAEGSYSASFTTTNTTINKTYNKTYNDAVPGVGGSQKEPDNKATGGRLQANTPYIVGDGPGGRLTPYSELFIPDQSGYLVDATNTAALLNGNRSQNSTTASSAEAAAGGDTYIFQITIEGNRTDLDHVANATKSSILEAAAQIGLKL